MVDDHILIAGLGISGFEAALLALTKSSNVTVVDTFESTALQNRAAALTEKGAVVHTGANLETLSFALKPKIIVISPGIHPKEEFGKFIYNLDAPVISELEFAATYTDIPLIGITGTNGKTTTVELITHCLNSMGSKAIAAGNIGLALSKVIRDGAKFDFIVVEVSSFQLEAINDISFIAGAILNISSDHIDRYDSFEDYGNTKIKLWAHSTHRTVSQSLVNENWPMDTKGLRTISSFDKKADLYLRENEIIHKNKSYSYKKHPLKGVHNAENLMTAMSVLNHCGFSFEDIFKASLTYQTAAHRMQHFLSAHGVDFINDSKATNPHALLMALNSLGLTDKRNIVLIAGGRDKKMDFKIVNTALCSYTRMVYLYGECRARLFEVWEDETTCIICDDFSDAVQKSLQEVKQGEILLLSPGCSSLDSFRNYEDRGNFFINAVQEWTENE